MVLDSSGARITSASVVAPNRNTDLRYPSITAEAGVYVRPQLPLGLYTVTVELGGFS
jgi:hypothetical protein